MVNDLYLLMLGVVAIVTMLKAPRGVWDFSPTASGLQIFPAAAPRHPKD